MTQVCGLYHVGYCIDEIFHENIKSKERTTQCSHQYKVSRGSIYVTLPLQEERFQLNLVTEIAKEQSYYDVMSRSILYQIVVMNYITKFNLWIVMLWLI